MKTDCNEKTFSFHEVGRREIIAQFDGGDITSDAGALLLKEVERGTQLLRRFAGCFTDHRAAELIEHTVAELVAQRSYALTLGYEDLNDHDDLRRDPLLAALVGKTDPKGRDRRREQDRGKALAGKSTLNRLELTLSDAGRSERYKKIVLDGNAVDVLFVEEFLRARGGDAPERIVLDLDCTDDPLHGNQEGRFFHGYYGEYCYLPLYVFCDGFLLCARLRTADIDGAAGSVKELERIVSQIREKWPTVTIVIRADSGFCREEIMAWCESHDVGFVLGLAKNSRLIEAIAEELQQAKALHDESKKAARVFKDFTYQTRETWSRERRVVGKAEHLDQGANPRFVVTSLSGAEMQASVLYEDFYCARGEMENRIKEQQLYLFADRTSTATMRANQIRLYFSSIAYVLLHTLRSVGLKGTEMATAQCHTIRLKLLKIGAQIRVTVRKIWVSLASGHPYADMFAAAYRNLQAMTPLHC